MKNDTERYKMIQFGSELEFSNNLWLKHRFYHTLLFSIQNDTV